MPTNPHSSFENNPFCLSRKYILHVMYVLFAKNKENYVLLAKNKENYVFTWNHLVDFHLVRKNYQTSDHLARNMSTDWDELNWTNWIFSNSDLFVFAWCNKIRSRRQNFHVSHAIFITWNLHNFVTLVTKIWYQKLDCVVSNRQSTVIIQRQC